MGHRAKELEQARKARARLRMIQHYEQVTRNVSRTYSSGERALTLGIEPLPLRGD